MADWWAYAAHGVQLGALKPAWLNSWDRGLQRSQGLTGDPIPEMDVPDDYSKQETRIIRGLYERIMLEGGEPVCFEYLYGACWCGLSFGEFANTWKRLGKRDAITAIEGTSPKRYRLGGAAEARFDRLVSWPRGYETGWLFHWDDFPEAVETLSGLITARKALPEHREPAPAAGGDAQTIGNEESVCHAVRNSCWCGCGSPVNVEKGQKYVNDGHRMRAKRNQTKEVYALEGGVAWDN
jgi:hypothetical protein